MVDELDDALPTCPSCGVRRLDVGGNEEHPHWECPGCGYVAIAV